jgi:hypothetical protein
VKPSGPSTGAGASGEFLRAFWRFLRQQRHVWIHSRAVYTDREQGSHSGAIRLFLRTELGASWAVLSDS